MLSLMRRSISASARRSRELFGVRTCLDSVPLLAAISVLVGSTMANAFDGRPAIPNELIPRGVIVRPGAVVEILDTATVNDADFEEIEDLGHIDSLISRSCTLTSRGLISILLKAEGIRSVALHGPGVTDDVIAALGKQPALETIDLRGPIRGENLELLVPLSPSLRSLALRCEPVPREPQFMTETFGLADDATKQIGRFHRLQYLTLIECGISDEHLKPLRSLSELRLLYLDGNPIEGHGLAALAELKRFRELTLSSCRLSDRGLASFPHLGSLTLLSLANNQITDAAVASLVEADLDELSSLILSRTDVTDRSLALLTLLKRLRSVDLSDTRVKAVGALSALPITGLDLSWTPVSDQTVQQLSLFSQLKALYLYNTPITYDALPTLAALDLSTLYVGNTNLSEVSVDTLRKKLPDCRVNARDEGSLFYTPLVSAGPRVAKAWYPSAQ